MKNKIKFLPIGILTLTTMVSGAALAGSSAIATSNNASVTVTTSCGYTSGSSFSTTLSVDAGETHTTESDAPSKSSFSVTCNNPDGFKVNAIGFSPTASSEGEGVEGTTYLYSSAGTIATGTSGADSYWAFKVSSTSASGTTASIVSPYSDYSVIPSSSTAVVNFAATDSTDDVTGTVKTDYKIFASSSQPAGTYTGAVKYVLVEN